MANSVLHFAKWKKEGKKISMITAYDYLSAKLVDTAGTDAILVGDSLGMVILGYKDTLKVTMQDMIHHCAAASRGNKNALLVCDMPFMSYRLSIENTVKNAGRLIQEANAQAVKLEGAGIYIPHIEAIVAAQIPVMGHLGLTPQSVHAFGGFKVQGKTDTAAAKIKEDALRLQDAGCFSIVLEGIPKDLAKEITDSLEIPTIGIGAGVDCDGQVLVYHDLLGMDADFSPKFVKKYLDGHHDMTTAFKEYIQEVENGTFPTDKHSF